MKRICDLCAGIAECNVIDRDLERAQRNLGGQPWLLRHWGEPVDTIYLPDGTSKYVLRRDHNLSMVERTRYRRG